MRPPAYFEPPPSYDEDLENERKKLQESQRKTSEEVRNKQQNRDNKDVEKGQKKRKVNRRKTKEEAEEEEQEAEEKRAYVLVAVIVILVVFFIMEGMTSSDREESKKRELENSQHDKVITTKEGGLRLFVDGNDTISINGTQHTPRGSRWPEYQVDLPLYTLSWSDGQFHQRDILFNIHSKGQESQTRTMRDAHACRRDGTKCFIFTTWKEITAPIILEYTVIYEISHPIRNQEKKNLLFFNRKFNVDQWEIQN